MKHLAKGVADISRALGVLQWGTEGSRRLLQQKSEAGAARSRGQKLSPPESDRHLQSALERGLRRGERWGELRWTQEQL
jgi:hypothetical protein